MNLKQLVLPSLLLLCSLYPIQLFAEQLSNYSARVQGDLGELHQMYAAYENNTLVSVTNPLRLSVTMRGWAHSITIEKVIPQDWSAEFFDGSKRISDPTKVLLLEGVISSGTRQTSHGRVAGSLSLRDGKTVLKLHYVRSRASRPDQGLGLVSVLTDSQVSTLAGIRRTRKHLDGYCGLQSLPSLPLTQEQQHSYSTLEYQSLDMQLHADPQYSSIYGSSTNAEIADIINAVNVIYTRDIGIEFAIDSLTALTGSDPFNGVTDAEALVNAYLQYAFQQGYGNSDLSHLFTGREIDGTTVGIAAFGQICVGRPQSVGFSSDLGTSTYLVTAHELGHNLGANHDTELMAPSFPLPAQFSNFSINEVSTFIANNNSCYTPADSNSTPTPTPSPSATPTPDGGGSGTPTPTGTSTPTPTSSGSGGGGISGGEVSPNLAMEASFDSTTGDLSITAVLEQLGVSCTVDVLMESKLAKLQSAKARVSYNPSLFLTQTWDSFAPRRVKKVRTKKGRVVKPKLYLALRHNCSGATPSFSNAGFIKLNRIRGENKKPVKLNKWIKLWIANLEE